ncbi:serine/threonine-protein kinase PCRK1-like isoform X1 [Camellia sinensis]|uniref:serine/threonine-protein kinase PCRK1-like isoform X1 n=2 Tax=Camellia sinensis TaxID=4442 RepID=UPI001036D135|nr:serine/threonine-protein kinase PCRK1-like isoform X1 [Camellia sinensis]
MRVCLSLRIDCSSNSTLVIQVIGSFGAMKCFSCSNGDKNDEPKTTKSISVRSSTSTSTDREARKSGSEFNSQNASDVSTESCTRISFTILSQRPSNLRVFTYDELRTATRNFSRSLMIGEGGFGGVYRGVIREAEDSNKKIDIAVKQLSRRGLQGHKEWVTEVNVLGVVEHPNLVKLVGYCSEDDERGMQRLLVYEYMPNRSVQDHISSRFQIPVPWITRLKIAQDAARGLVYLHEGMEFQIIFRDFKSSNILLDGQWNAKLSDFGLARLGPSDGVSHVSTAVVGTVGYAAPEYIQTGRLTYKSDVWSYGVFLYELITGRRPLDRNRPKNEQKLLDWVRPHLSDLKKFELIVDPRLNGRYSRKSAQKLAAIANRCLVRHPKLRPKMSEVLEMVNRIVEEVEMGIPEAPIKSTPPKEANGKTLGEGLKRRFVDPIIGENRWLAWRTWRPKLVTSS